MRTFQLILVLISTFWIGLACSAAPQVAAPGVGAPAENQHPPSTASAPATSSQHEPTTPSDLQPIDSPLHVFPHDPSWGHPDALVTIIQFGDLECPFTARAKPTLEALKDRYGPEQIRIVWKDNPLPFHRSALPAHLYAAAVFSLGGADAFWKFQDAAFTHPSELKAERFHAWAQEIGLNPERIERLAQTGAIEAGIAEDQGLAKKVDALGTPSFRINGITVNGAQPLVVFTKVIDAELVRAHAALAKGTARSKVSPWLTEQNYKAPPPLVEHPEPAPDLNIYRVPVYPEDPIRGNKNALVTLVMFSDFQCPFCLKVEDTLTQLIEHYGDDLRVVWKDNPLDVHKRARPAATLARVAFERGGNALFWRAHKRLFAEQQHLDDEHLEGIAQELKLPWPVVKQAIEDQKHQKHFEKTQGLAEDLEALGTPHFFINGLRLAGAQSFNKFKELIDEQLVGAREIEKSGVARSRIYEHLQKSGILSTHFERVTAAAPDAKSPFQGAVNAKVVVQIFGDFECPFCARVGPTLRNVLAAHPGQMKVVWRHNPLPFHPRAFLAAEAAEEAFAQKGNAGFWAYHDKLFENQKHLERADLERYAEELGLDLERFKTALDARIHRARIQAEVAAANQAKVVGTPTLFFNDYLVSGAQTLRKLEKAFQHAHKNP